MKNKGELRMEQVHYIHELPGQAGIAAPLSLAGRPFTPGKKARVHILALGDVGMTMLIGLRLLGAADIACIGICDLNENNLRRLEIEINQIRYPFAGQGDGPVLPPVYMVTEEQLFDCDVFIFCASKGVPPLSAKGDVRMAQLEANKGLIGHFAGLARQAAYGGLVCIVSDPVDPLCAAFLDESGVQPWQIQGYGLGVMNARACYYAEQDERMVHYLKEGRAFGPHGEDLVIADRIDGYDDALSRELTRKVVEANYVVRNLGYKPYIAPALSSAALSILLTLEGRWHYGSVYLGDRDRGAFLGVRSRYTDEGLAYEDRSLPKALYDRIAYAYLRLCELR